MYQRLKLVNQMAVSELSLLILSCSQPAIVGLFAFIGLGRQVSSKDLAQSLSSMHQKLGVYRFYECATYSRLNGLVKYQISFFSIVVAYIVYDIDLVFFVAEVVMVPHYGLVCLLIMAFFFMCLLVGLWYDYVSVGYSWGSR